MTTTPTSGAAIQRYKIGYHPDEWGQRSSTPSGIPDASGSWVRYADHVTALAAGQAPKAAPVEQDDHQILAITTAYEQGVGKGHQAYNSGKEIANPYSPAYRCDLAWQYGYKEGKEQAQREAKAAPQQEAQEPAMIYHGRCTIDCGEGGHHDMEMLRMIPAGSKLYTAPQPAQGFRRGQAAAKQEG